MRDKDKIKKPHSIKDYIIPTLQTQYALYKDFKNYDKSKVGK